MVEKNPIKFKKCIDKCGNNYDNDYHFSMSNVNKYENSLNFKLIPDYFNFEKNDIDLHKMEKCFIKYSWVFNMRSKEEIVKDYNEFIFSFVKNDMIKSTFPYLKNSISEYLDALNLKYNNIYDTYYFIMLILANRNTVTKIVREFYLGIIKSNSFGITPNFSSVITQNVLKSDEYNQFLSKLADWYTKTELIIYYTMLLNKFFGVVLNYDQEKYSLEKNFDFSIKSFAKKNFLKLASFIFKNISYEINITENIDYKKLLFVIASSFTCGISIKEVFMGDIKQIGMIVGGVCFNFLISKIANRIDNYTDFIEFKRMEKIIIKLNKKTEKVHKKIYELLKLFLITRVDYNFFSKKQKDFNNNLQSEVYPNIDDKIEELLMIVRKYFEGVENIDDETEKKIIQEIFFYQEESIRNSVIDDTWAFINICKN